MEDVIFYLIVAGAVIVNIVRNYQKVTKENKERDISKPVVPTRTDTTVAPAKQAPRPTNIPKPILKQEARKEERPVVEKAKPTIFSYDTDTPFDKIESFETSKVDYEKYDISRITFFDEPIVENNKPITEEKQSFDLQLDTQEDMKRAFVHSLIFERKY